MIIPILNYFVVKVKGMFQLIHLILPLFPPAKRGK